MALRKEVDIHVICKDRVALNREQKQVKSSLYWKVRSTSVREKNNTRNKYKVTIYSNLQLFRVKKGFKNVFISLTGNPVYIDEEKKKGTGILLFNKYSLFNTSLKLIEYFFFIKKLVYNFDNQFRAIFNLKFYVMWAGNKIIKKNSKIFRSAGRKSRIELLSSFINVMFLSFAELRSAEIFTGERLPFSFLSFFFSFLKIKRNKKNISFIYSNLIHNLINRLFFVKYLLYYFDDRKIRK